MADQKRITTLDSRLETWPPERKTAVKDIYLAAFLNFLGYPLVFTRSDGFQAEFYFADVPHSVIMEFVNNEGDGQMARRLFDSFQAMRRTSRQIREMTLAEIQVELTKQIEEDKARGPRRPRPPIAEDVELDERA